MKRVLANALPKNGTHLLLKCLGEIPGYSFSGFEIDWSDPSRALRLLGETRPGQFTKGHIPCFNEAREFIRRQELVVFNMVRDPRANVVSFYHYIMDHPDHPLHSHYASIESDDARLMATIRGFRDRQGDSVIRDIGWRLRNWVGWDKEDKVTNIRFEGLIGPRGGGKRELQAIEIRKILNVLEIKQGQVSAEEIGRRVFDTSVHSFRQGRIESWRDLFSIEHKQVFKEVANWALLYFDYETDDQW